MMGTDFAGMIDDLKLSIDTERKASNALRDELRTTLEHWRHECGKLHSQVDRLRAENAQLIAANQALMTQMAGA